MQTMEKLNSQIEELSGNKEFMIYTATFLTQLALIYFGTLLAQRISTSIFFPGC
jgi:hypothetical protein